MYEAGVLIALFVSVTELFCIICLYFLPLAPNMRKVNHYLKWSQGDFVFYPEDGPSIVWQILWYLVRASVFSALSWFSVVSWCVSKIFAISTGVFTVPDRVKAARWKLWNRHLTRVECLEVLAEIRCLDGADKDLFVRTLAEQLTDEEAA